MCSISSGTGDEEARDQQHQQRRHLETHHVAEQAHRQSQRAGDLTQQVKRQQDRIGLEIVAQIGPAGRRCGCRTSAPTQKTSRASATVTDRSPVGERSPGTRPIRFAAPMNSHSVPTKGSSRRGVPRRGALDRVLASASTHAFQRRLQAPRRIYAQLARAEPGQPASALPSAPRWSAPWRRHEPARGRKASSSRNSGLPIQCVRI